MRIPLLVGAAVGSWGRGPCMRRCFGGAAVRTRAGLGR